MYISIVLVLVGYLNFFCSSISSTDNKKQRQQCWLGSKKHMLF